MRNLHLRPVRAAVATSIFASVGAMAMSASAARGTEPPDDGSGEPVVSVIDDPRVALSVTHRADWVLADEVVLLSGGDDGSNPCSDALRFVLGIQHETRVQSAVTIELVPVDCDDDDDSIGNGWHGLYRTIDDVPEPIGVEHVETPIGAAVVFDQEYYECTNQCDDFLDRVAIVTLDDPADQRYPTVVIRDDAGQLDAGMLDEEEFAALLQRLGRLDDAAAATTEG
jgi:hypothetical protein